MLSSDLVVLKRVQALPGSLNDGGHVLVRKDQVTCQPRSPLCSTENRMQTSPLCCESRAGFTAPATAPFPTQAVG